MGYKKRSWSRLFTHVNNWIQYSATEYCIQIDSFIDAYKDSHPPNTDTDCLTYLLWNIQFE